MTRVTVYTGFALARVPSCRSSPRKPLIYCLNHLSCFLFKLKRFFSFDDISILCNNISLTVSVHLCVETFLQSTRSALISMSFIDWAFSFQITSSLASVNPISMNTSLEKSRTPFRGKHDSITLNLSNEKRFAYHHNCRFRNVFQMIDRRKRDTECPTSDRLNRKNIQERKIEKLLINRQSSSPFIK